MCVVPKVHRLSLQASIRWCTILEERVSITIVGQGDTAGLFLHGLKIEWILGILKESLRSGPAHEIAEPQRPVSSAVAGRRESPLQRQKPRRSFGTTPRTGTGGGGSIRDRERRGSHQGRHRRRDDDRHPGGKHSSSEAGRIPSMTDTALKELIEKSLNEVR